MAQGYGELGQSEKMANVRQESMLGGGADGFDGVQVDREMVRVLCNLFFQLNQKRLERNQRSSYANLI